jgi:hypothetical protein
MALSATHIYYPNYETPQAIATLTESGLTRSMTVQVLPSATPEDIGAVDQWVASVAEHEGIPLNEVLRQVQNVDDAHEGEPLRPAGRS